jgi:hypothetical protein
VFCLVANETLTPSWRSQSNGKEWVGYKLRTTPVEKIRGSVNPFVSFFPLRLALAAFVLLFFSTALYNEASIVLFYFVFSTAIPS